VKPEHNELLDKVQLVDAGVLLPLSNAQVTYLRELSTIWKEDLPFVLYLAMSFPNRANDFDASSIAPPIGNDWTLAVMRLEEVLSTADRALNGSDSWDYAVSDDCAWCTELTSEIFHEFVTELVDGWRTAKADEEAVSELRMTAECCIKRDIVQARLHVAAAVRTRRTARWR